MSGIVIEDEAWRRIMADEQLYRARSRLSFHEIRLIVDHVRAAERERHHPHRSRRGGRAGGGTVTKQARFTQSDLARVFRAAKGADVTEPPEEHPIDPSVTTR